MRRTRTCPCDALPTVTLIRIRFRRLALDTFNMELRDIQADRDKHLAPAISHPCASPRSGPIAARHRHLAPAM